MVCTRDSCCRHWCLVDVVTESVRNGLMSEMLYADDLVLTSEKMGGD